MGQYLKNIPVASGEISIVKAKNAADIMKHSCQVAREAQSCGLGVLLLNTGLSEGRFKTAAEEAGIDWSAAKKSMYDSESGSRLYVHSYDAGDLATELDNMRYLVRVCDINLIIITSWEWTSSSWRKKEKLMFLLREFMHMASFVIYSQSATKTVLGENDRGGTGKLATVAYSVTELDESEKLEIIMPRPKLIVQRPGDIEAAERSAQLLINKINGIGGQVERDEAKDAAEIRKPKTIGGSGDAKDLIYPRVVA